MSQCSGLSSQELGDATKKYATAEQRAGAASVISSMNPKAYFTTDVGQHQMWAAQFLNVLCPKSGCCCCGCCCCCLHTTLYFRISTLAKKDEQRGLQMGCRHTCGRIYSSTWCRNLYYTYVFCKLRLRLLEFYTH